MSPAGKGSPSLGDFLDQEVYPHLSVEDVFTDPSHAWRERGKTWKGGCPWHESKTGSSFTVDPETLRWNCAGGCGGGSPTQYLHGLKTGSPSTPYGDDFVEIARELAARAGVSFPAREMTEEEKRKAHDREARRSVLDVVVSHGEAVLWSPAGETARAFLTKEKGLTEEAVRSLRLGFYDSVAGFRAALKKAGVDEKDAGETAVLWDKLEGYILIPWMDDRGLPLTLYGRWKEKTPPEDAPKYCALPGEDSKRSPLFYDRARAAGDHEVVLVEGAFDGVLLQARGDHRVVASVAAVASKLQVKTLVRNRVKAVYICGDPDGGGDKGTLSNIKNLEAAGISTFVVERLPDEMDPDEFVLRHGMDAWKDRVSRSTPGSVYKATHALEKVTPTSPPKEIREAVEKVLTIMEDLHGTRAALDQEDILRRLVDRTGYSSDALAVEIEDHTKKRKKEKADAAVRETFEKARKELERTDGEAADPLVLAREVSKSLSLLEGTAEVEPPWFDEERLWEELAVVPHGRPAGWDRLDSLGVRFHAGELAVLAARPGHAKTSVLVGLLWNWLRDSDPDEVFLFYSYEEMERQIYRRLLSLASVEVSAGRPAWGRNEIRDYRTNPKSRTDWPLLAYLEDARKRLSPMRDRFVIVRKSEWTADEIAAHALRQKDRGARIGGIFVDYLQLIGEPKEGGDRPDIVLSLITQRLKNLAVEVDAPVVTGAQMNRASIPDKFSSKIAEAGGYTEATGVIRTARPDLHHLRGGGIEHAADLVLGLLNYRADYRDSVEKVATIPDVTLLEAGVLKYREGEAGAWAGLAFDGQYGLVRDIRPDEEDQLRPEETPSAMVKEYTEGLNKRSVDRTEQARMKLEATKERTRQMELRAAEKAAKKTPKPTEPEEE